MRLRIVDAERRDERSTVTTWKEVVALREAVRMGRDVFLTGALRPAAISSAITALRAFRKEMDDAKIDAYRAVATSAVREAENAEMLVERADREAGVRIEVIEGVEEARLVQLAVQRRIALDGRRALLIDIGGGSTELTLLDGGELRASHSLPVGTVRLLEAFMETDVAVDAPHAELIHEYLERVFGEVADEIAKSEPEVLVATGGTVETLATLCPSSTPDGPAIDLPRVRRLLDALSEMSVKERMSRYGLREDRADTLIPAAGILLQIASPLDQAVVLAPGTGLKDGILEALADRHFGSETGDDDVVSQACLRLGRRYHFDEKHGTHVARLATTLFDDLVDLHGLRQRDRLLLRAASLLHDVGDFIRYEGHHKHSHYIIEHSDLMGLTPAERTVVANVARYHRKSFPDPSHPNFRDLGREDRARVRSLSAILRLADALDREHRQKVHNVRAVPGGGRLRLEIQGAPDRALEVWTVARKAELFRAVFDLDLEVVDAPAGRRGSARPGA